MIKTFFPIVITSSMLDTMSLCEMKTYRSYLQHLHGGRESTHLIAGAAFAKGLEVARRAYFQEEATPFEAQLAGMEAMREAYGDHVPFNGEDDKKSLQSMIAAFGMYFETYPLDLDDAVPLVLEDGSKAIEYQFSIELPFKHPELEDQNLIYSGRADMLVERYGQVWLLDDKTKGGYPPKDAQKAMKEWATRAQFSGYCAVVEQLTGLKIAGVIIREVYIQSKSTYSVREVVSTRNSFMKTNWFNQLNRVVEKWLSLYEKLCQTQTPFEVFNAAMTNTACWNYATPCAFMDWCTGDLTEQYIASNFEQSVWLGELGERMPLEQYIAMLKGEEFEIERTSVFSEAEEQTFFDFGVLV